MEINVKKSQKLLNIWVSHKDERDARMAERLADLYKWYGRKGYTVVVFRSGQQDLADVTSELLVRNRKQLTAGP